MSRKRMRVVGQTVTCGWCGSGIELAATGRIPKRCSQACRQQAWEQRRAAQSGLAAVEVVVHPVEVEKQVEVRVIERVEVPVVPRGAAWPPVLAELVVQLDRGLVYDRHLPDLVGALDQVLRALERRRFAVPVKLRQRRP